MNQPNFEVATEATSRLKVTWKFEDLMHVKNASSPAFCSPSTQDVWELFLNKTKYPNKLTLSMKLFSREEGNLKPVDVLLKISGIQYPDSPGWRYKRVLLGGGSFTFRVGQVVEILSLSENSYDVMFKRGYSESLMFLLDIIHMSPHESYTGSLAEDMRRFQHCDSESNLRIICKNSEVVETNKLYLMMRSKQMISELSTLGIESNKCSLSLAEYSKSTVEAFVSFNKTDEVADLADHAEDLYVLADKYKIPKLKLLCEVNMARNVTQSTAPAILVLNYRIPSAIITTALIGLLNKTE